MPFTMDLKEGQTAASTSLDTRCIGTATLMHTEIETSSLPMSTAVPFTMGVKEGQTTTSTSLDARCIGTAMIAEPEMETTSLPMSNTMSSVMDLKEGHTTASTSLDERYIDATLMQTEMESSSLPMSNTMPSVMDLKKGQTTTSTSLDARCIDATIMQTEIESLPPMSTPIPSTIDLKEVQTAASISVDARCKDATLMQPEMESSSLPRSTTMPLAVALKEVQTAASTSSGARCTDSTLMQPEMESSSLPISSATPLSIDPKEGQTTASISVDDRCTDAPLMQPEMESSSLPISSAMLSTIDLKEVQTGASTSLEAAIQDVHRYHEMRYSELEQSSAKKIENLSIENEQLREQIRTLQAVIAHGPASADEGSPSARNSEENQSSFQCAPSLPLVGNGAVIGAFTLPRETKISIENNYAKKLALESDWLDIREDEKGKGGATVIVERMGKEEWQVLSSLAPVFSRMMENDGHGSASLDEVRHLFDPLSASNRRRRSKFFALDYSRVGDATHQAIVNLLEGPFTKAVGYTLNALRNEKECYALGIGTVDDDNGGEPTEVDAVAIFGLPATEWGALDFAPKREDPINSQEYKPAILYYLSVRSGLKRKRVGSDLGKCVCALVRYRGLGPAKIVAAVAKANTSAVAFYEKCGFLEHDWRKQCSYVQNYADTFGMVSRRGKVSHSAYILRGFLCVNQKDGGDGSEYCGGGGGDDAGNADDQYDTTPSDDDLDEDYKNDYNSTKRRCPRSKLDDDSRKKKKRTSYATKFLVFDGRKGRKNKVLAKIQGVLNLEDKDTGVGGTEIHFTTISKIKAAGDKGFPCRGGRFLIKLYEESRHPMWDKIKTDDATFRALKKEANEEKFGKRYVVREKTKNGAIIGVYQRREELQRAINRGVYDKNFSKDKVKKMQKTKLGGYLHKGVYLIQMYDEEAHGNLTRLKK